MLNIYLNKEVSTFVDGVPEGVGLTPEEVQTCTSWYQGGEQRPPYVLSESSDALCFIADNRGRYMLLRHPQEGGNRYHFVCMNYTPEYFCLTEAEVYGLVWSGNVHPLMLRSCATKVAEWLHSGTTSYYKYDNWAIHVLHRPTTPDRTTYPFTLQKVNGGTAYKKTPGLYDLYAGTWATQHNLPYAAVDVVADTVLGKVRYGWEHEMLNPRRTVGGVIFFVKKQGRWQVTVG